MLKLKPAAKYLIILLGFSLATLTGCAEGEDEPELLDWQASGLDLKESKVPGEVDEITALNEYLLQIKKELQLLYLPPEVEKDFLEKINLQVEEKEAAKDNAENDSNNDQGFKVTIKYPDTDWISKHMQEDVKGKFPDVIGIELKERLSVAEDIFFELAEDPAMIEETAVISGAGEAGELPEFQPVDFFRKSVELAGLSMHQPDQVFALPPRDPGPPQSYLSLDEGILIKPGPGNSMVLCFNEGEKYYFPGPVSSAVILNDRFIVSNEEGTGVYEKDEDSGELVLIEQLSSEELELTRTDNYAAGINKDKIFVFEKYNNAVEIAAELKEEYTFSGFERHGRHFQPVVAVGDNKLLAATIEKGVILFDVAEQSYTELEIGGAQEAEIWLELGRTTEKEIIETEITGLTDSGIIMVELAGSRGRLVQLHAPREPGKMEDYRLVSEIAIQRGPDGMTRDTDPAMDFGNIRHYSEADYWSNSEGPYIWQTLSLLDLKEDKVLDSVSGLQPDEANRMENLKLDHDPEMEFGEFSLEEEVKVNAPLSSYFEVVYTTSYPLPGDGPPPPMFIRDFSGNTVPELLFSLSDGLYKASKPGDNASKEAQLSLVESAHLAPHVSSRDIVVGISGEREEAYFLQVVGNQHIVYSVPWQELASPGETQGVLTGRAKLINKLDLKDGPAYIPHNLAGPVKGEEALYQASGNKLAALDPATEEVIWEFDAGNNLAAPALGDGALYAAPAGDRDEEEKEDYELYRLDKTTGETLNSIKIDRPVTALPVKHEEALVVGDEGQTITAYSAKLEKEIWEYGGSCRPEKIMAVGDPLVVLGEDETTENLTALDLDSGEVTWTKDNITHLEKDGENLYLATKSEILKVESDTGEIKDRLMEAYFDSQEYETGITEFAVFDDGIIMTWDDQHFRYYDLEEERFLWQIDRSFRSPAPAPTQFAEGDEYLYLAYPNGDTVGLDKGSGFVTEIISSEHYINWTNGPFTPAYFTDDLTYFTAANRLYYVD